PIRRYKAFDPDATWAMGEAYDKAIGTIYPDAESRFVVRELIAKRIIRMAQKGVVDSRSTVYISGSDYHSFWRFRIGSRMTSSLATVWWKSPQSAGPHRASIISPLIAVPARHRNRHARAPVRCGHGPQSTRIAPRLTK